MVGAVALAACVVACALNSATEPRVVGSVSSWEGIAHLLPLEQTYSREDE